MFHFALLGQSYYFRHYQVENGLSNNTVVCSLQDKMGFIWFGTKDGLNRFDGYSFKTFRRTVDKPGSLGNNNIHSIYEDKQGRLWVGTEKGLYQYLKRTEEFRLVSATTGRYVDRVTGDDKGNLWFISNFELCRYATPTNQLRVYDHQNYFVTTAICSSPDGTIWASTADGQLKTYQPKSDSFVGFNLFTHSKPGASTWLESLYYSSYGYLIAGTSDTEIKLLDPVHSVYTDITLPHSGQTNLYIRSILQTSPNELWLGTESGVFIYNLKTKDCHRLKKDYSDPYSINDNAIYTACRDREGGVWLGTYFGGINYLPNQQTPFVKYYPKNGENALSGNVVREIKKDHYGNLWVGTEDAGLNKLDPSGRFTHFEPDGRPGSIAFFNIHGLLATGDELWIGTFQHGLDVMNVRTGKVIRHYDAGAASGLTHNFIYCIYQTAGGQIMIGNPHGVFRHNKARNIFEREEGLPTGAWYTSILQDKKGTIWGGTFGNGVHYYNPAMGKSGTFLYNAKDSNSLGSDRVNSIFEDSHHNLWFATEEGLCKLNEQTHRFTRYGTADGFPSDFILCLLEDQKQNLWISTTKGLVRFHPASGKLQVYTVSNGLIGDQFNYSSAFKDPDGNMYFGSAKGLIRFRPEEFSQSKDTAPVYLTGFQVNGQEVAIDSSVSPLKKSILYTDKIILTHHQSTFSIDFAALNFTAPEAVQYQYRMKGLADNWVKTNRRVDFIELSPGTYRFCVKAFTNGGAWSKETKLTIVVLPPWWASRWAYAVYGFLTLLLVYALVRYYHRRMNEKNKRKYELLKMASEKEILEIELAKEKELLEAKIDFFTNVAHEIKTPLTLIKVPLKKVIKKAGNNPKIENSLKIMDRNTNRLIELTGQLLDFRQTEINKFHLSFERADISSLVAEACSGFTTLAEQNNISLSLRLPQNNFFAYVDVDAFNKITYNVFSNAVKYAESKVCIALLPYSKDGHCFTIQVKNDGHLIPEDLGEKIFEPFYRIRANENQTGTGIGLALARSLVHLHGGILSLDPPEGNMNVFSLTLPIHNEPENTLHHKLSPSNQSDE